MTELYSSNERPALTPEQTLPSTRCVGEIIYACSYGGSIDDHEYHNSGIKVTAAWLETVKSQKGVRCEEPDTLWIDFSLTTDTVLSDDNIEPELVVARQLCYKSYSELLASYFGFTTIYAFLAKVFTPDRLRPIQLNAYDRNHSRFIDSMLSDVRFIVCIKRPPAVEAVQELPIPDDPLDGNNARSMTPDPFIDILAEPDEMQSAFVDDSVAQFDVTEFSEAFMKYENTRKTRHDVDSMPFNRFRSSTPVNASVTNTGTGGTVDIIPETLTSLTSTKTDNATSLKSTKTDNATNLTSTKADNAYRTSTKADNYTNISSNYGNAANKTNSLVTTSRASKYTDNVSNTNENQDSISSYPYNVSKSNTSGIQNPIYNYQDSVVHFTDGFAASSRKSPETGFVVKTNNDVTQTPMTSNPEDSVNSRTLTDTDIGERVAATHDPITTQLTFLNTEYPSGDEDMDTDDELNDETIESTLPETTFLIDSDDEYTVHRKYNSTPEFSLNVLSVTRTMPLFENMPQNRFVVVYESVKEGNEVVYRAVSTELNDEKGLSLSHYRATISLNELMDLFRPIVGHAAQFSHPPRLDTISFKDINQSLVVDEEQIFIVFTEPEQ